MKALILANRNSKEILRDPLNLFFGLAFPLILIFLLTAIAKNVPASPFSIEHLIPGITVFGLSFMSLFSAVLISKDRESAFLSRLYASPLKSSDFIFSYTLPFIPISLLQSIICYVVSFPLGLEPKATIFLALLGIIPVSLLFISLGLLCGSLFNSKQVGGICGALLTNLSAWLSGTWFDVSLPGKAFEAIAKALPFYHAVELESSLYNNNLEGITIHLIVVFVYTIIIFILSLLAFLRQMKNK